MTTLYLAGTGMTKFGLYVDRSVKTMVREAVTACLADAGATPGDVQAAYFSNLGQSVIDGQTAVPGQVALRPLGFQGLPIVNVENGCASASSALWLACAQLKAGMADVALAVGAEKLSTVDTTLRDKVFAGGMDVEDVEGTFERLRALGRGIDGPPAQGERSVFMDVYGCWARGHMREYGTTQRQLAAIAAKNHRHSAENPLCQFQKQFSIEEVLAGRALAYPLTVPMCSPYSDGCAAAIVCTERGLARLGVPRSRAIRLLACELRSGVDRGLDRFFDLHITKLTAEAAYAAAGLGPQDVDLAEVHDATAFGELLNTENLGLVPRGEGGPAAARGETTLGGRIPVNPSGGLESRGHPLGATGLAQIHELVMQLRGEAGPRQVANARIAIAENGGGLWGVEEASAVVTVLGQ
ncbi:MAG: thiolase family protein [Gammaproteobacteria bacterium]|nr:thiolase family protein [Gammaproteobacteria bacterium]